MATVREILSRENPGIINAWDGRSYANTVSAKKIYDAVVFDELHNCTIQDWTDFTYDAIDLAYGDILDRAPANYKPVNTPTETPRTIAEEKGIDKLGEAWTCNIVRAPIKAAGAVVRLRPSVAGAKESDPSLSSFAIKWKHPQETKTELDPDWAVFDRRTPPKQYREEAEGAPLKPLVYAVGDSKMWQKWQSAWLHKSLAKECVDRDPARPVSGRVIQQTHDVTSERLKPLAQLATYCRFAQTRYGFILTQEELVVFRVRRIASGQIHRESIKEPNKFHAAFEYKAVPWGASGPRKLTVNLAIWALGCMGMNDEHREMEGRSNIALTAMVRLTKWTHDKTKSLYRNNISGREIKEADWLKLGPKTKFVQLDDKDSGFSLTSSFVKKASSVSDLDQGMKNLDIKPTPPTGSGNQPKDAGEKPVQNAKKYKIEGTEGPIYELKVKDGKTYFKKDAKTVIHVTMHPQKKQYYYTIADPKDAKKKQVFYLKQV